jgi:phosphinothricin acetyltransferase
MDIEIRPLKQDDWTAVADIYKQGIETGNATFQNDIPTWDEWNSVHLKACRIVATLNSEIVGWAALAPVSARQVYAGVAEVSVYVSNLFKGNKVGTILLKTLISESEKEGFWTLQASIFQENIASLRLHDNLGFRRVGFRERIGKMDGRWRDTILLERRSKIVGGDL